MKQNGDDDDDRYKRNNSEKTGLENKINYGHYFKINVGGTKNSEIRNLYFKINFYNNNFNS